MFDKSFMDACCAGELDVKSIDKYVTFWHENDMGKSLREFLGMNPMEYACWLRDGNAGLGGIVAAHEDNKKRFLEISSGCSYHLDIPSVGTCCDAYSQSKREDGRHWAHYPNCCEDSCPLLYPVLLEGARLKDVEGS